MAREIGGNLENNIFFSRKLWEAKCNKGFPGGASGKEPTCQCRRQEMQVLSLGWEDPLEEGMATHSSILAWRIPMDRGTWQATVHGVTTSRT